ncbi:hypothetical protein EMMF5_006209 [Cystobasidiomycetes sp. EMM_F5]
MTKRRRLVGGYYLGFKVQLANGSSTQVDQGMKEEELLAIFGSETIPYVHATQSNVRVQLDRHGVVKRLLPPAARTPSPPAPAVPSQPGMGKSPFTRPSAYKSNPGDPTRNTVEGASGTPGPQHHRASPSAVVASSQLQAMLTDNRSTAGRDFSYPNRTKPPTGEPRMSSKPVGGIFSSEGR